MKQSKILLKLVFLSVLFVLLAVQAVYAEPFTATYNSSEMWPVQGSTTDKPVIYYKSHQEFFTCSEINGKMEVGRYKLPADTEWVGVVNSNIYTYNESRTIKKYNILTGTTQDIVKTPDTFASPYSDGNYVYYLKGTQLMAIDPQTGKSKTVLTVPGLKGFSTAYTAKNSALIYNISVVDGYFYYVLSKKQVVGSKTIDTPSVLYRIPLKEPITPEALIQFDDNDGYRAPGMAYLIKDNILVMVNQNRMLDLKTKKFIPINNACLYTYISGNHVYQKLPDESYQEMNIASTGGFIENKVYKDIYEIPYSYGDYKVNVYGNIIRFANAAIKEKKYFGIVELNRYNLSELKLIGDGAPYAAIDDPKKKTAFEKAIKVVKDLIKPDMSELDKVLVLHDWVINNAAFDWDTFNGTKSTNESYYWAGVFSNHLAVSAGYASGYEILLSLSGIESEYATGTGVDGGVHAWNKVKVNDKWYKLDIVKDYLSDTKEKSDLPEILRSYSKSQSWVEMCNFIDENYFIKKSVKVKSIEELKKVLMDKRDDSMIFVIFEDFKPTDEQISAVSNLFPGCFVRNNSYTIYSENEVNVYKFVIEKR